MESNPVILPDELLPNLLDAGDSVEGKVKDNENTVCEDMYYVVVEAAVTTEGRDSDIMDDTNKTIQTQYKDYFGVVLKALRIGNE